MDREKIISVLGENTVNIIEAYLRACEEHACKWVDNDGDWTASCGLPWTFEDSGNPNDHGVIHCPRCGGRVEVAHENT
jgi:hypothetical protein